MIDLTPAEAGCDDTTFVILEDSRQQIGKHENIHAWFDAHNVRYDRCRLYCGDYIIANRGNIAVDTKQSVMELIQDVYQDHERFRRECIRAQHAGIRLIVLTEEELPNGRLECWAPPILPDGRPSSRANPVRLRKTLLTMQEKYGVRFRFCSPAETGRLILEYLKGDPGYVPT